MLKNETREAEIDALRLRLSRLRSRLLDANSPEHRQVLVNLITIAQQELAVMTRPRVYKVI